MIVKLGSMPLRTKNGTFTFTSWYDGQSEAYSASIGEIENETNVPLRLHSSCITAHYFQSIECDCREQMDLAFERISSIGYGLIVVLNQQAKSNGILATIGEKNIPGPRLNSVAAFKELGYPGDSRSYLAAASIIKALSIKKVILLSNNPNKQRQLRDAGVEVSSMEQIKIPERQRPDLAAHYSGKRDVEGHNV